MVTLLPRLPGPAAQSLAMQFVEHGTERWRGFNEHQLPEAARFAATGGSRATPRQLRDLRNGLEELARSQGFGGTSSRGGFAQFDAETSAWLAQNDLFMGGEALRDDVWAFVGAAVAPDIAHWRFGTPLERYLGGIRNTFQRLWMRGRSFDRGQGHPDRWRLLHELTEDALVQITERPSLGSNPRLALAIAEAWLRASEKHGKSAMESVMRRAALKVRITNEIRNLSDLGDAELARVLNSAFDLAAEAG